MAHPSLAIVKDTILYTTSLAVTAMAIKLFVTSVNPISAVAFLTLSSLVSMLTHHMPILREYTARYPFTLMILQTATALFAIQKFLDPSFTLLALVKTLVTAGITSVVLLLSSIGYRHMVVEMKETFIQHDPSVTQPINDLDQVIFG